MVKIRDWSKVLPEKNGMRLKWSKIDWLALHPVLKWPVDPPHPLLVPQNPRTAVRLGSSFVGVPLGPYFSGKLAA